MLMRAITFTMYLAIPMPSNDEFEGDTRRSVHSLYDTLDELSALSGKLDFHFFDELISPYRPTIKLVKRRRRTDKRLAEWFYPDDKYLSISATVSLKKAARVRLTPTVSDGEEHGLYELLARDAFVKQVYDLLVLTNISRIGSIEIDRSILLRSGEVYCFDPLPVIDAWALQRAAVLAESIGWPKLCELSIAEAWRWFTTREGFREGLGGGPTGRAFNAVSRILEPTDSDEAMKLVWALIGIEAVYVKGKVSIMEQVREKVQAFLGKQETYKKKIVEMYDFRSRFIHGDLDFPGLFVFADGHPAAERYHSDQFESVNMAVAILVATIQELILRDWSGIDFPYTATNSLTNAAQPLATADA
jgi:hypothetical protein